MVELEQLIVVDELYGRVFPLQEERTTIGRAKDCDICVARGSIGRRHAEVRRSDGGLWVHDLGSTNGTYVVSGTDTMARPVRGRVRIAVGDSILLGIARLVVRPASWLGDAPPGSWPVEPLPPARAAAVLEDVRRGAAAGLDGATVDAAWVTEFSHWRRTRAAAKPLTELGHLLSPTMLVTVRAALDDPIRWFVNSGLDFLRMLADSPHPLGAALALDVRLRHPSRGFREVAGACVRELATAQGTTVTQLAWTRFIALADGTLDPLQVDFAANAIESARKQGIAWSVRDWNRLMSHSAFVQAASHVVFVIPERDLMFRVADGELLGLDDLVTLRDDEHIAVAGSLNEAWQQHLADYEIVQVFPQ